MLSETIENFVGKSVSGYTHDCIEVQSQAFGNLKGMLVMCRV